MGQKRLPPGSVFADAIRAELLSRLGGDGQLNRNTLAPLVAEVVSRPRLYRVLAGEKAMTVAELGAICAALRVPVLTVVRATERATAESVSDDGVATRPSAPQPARGPRTPPARSRRD